jgi:oxysterol-binding protein 1
MQVDAQNRFTGKSFEIRPTGVANVEILLPAGWEPTYPKTKNESLDSERAVEHYSWKKVTTNVSGFILGSPTIDHYGDMVVRSIPSVESHHTFTLILQGHKPSDK